MVTLAAHNFTAHGFTSLRGEDFCACKVGFLLSFGAIFLVVVESVDTLTWRDKTVQIPLVDLVEGMPVANLFIITITRELASRNLKRFFLPHGSGIGVHEVCKLGRLQNCVYRLVKPFDLLARGH